MWERIKRIFRSFVGFFIELGEDPELILRQNIRDMEDQVPAMNQSIAMMKANQTLLEKEFKRLEKEERELTSKIQAALKAGRRDIALSFAQRLEQIKADKSDTEEQMQAATEATKKALQVKEIFIREKDRKGKEAMAAIQSKKRAEWQSKVADTMESFKVAGIDSSHDEMIRKLDEVSAQKKAKMELALGNIDHASFEIEQEAKNLEANALLQQFELQMGLVQAPDAASAPPEKTMGSAEAEKTRESEKS